MYIEKRSSSSYRVVQMISGKKYTVSVDHRPTKSEATRLIAEVLASKPKRADVKTTFSEGAQQYIDDKDNVLSPSTQYGYLCLKRLIDRLYPEFTQMRMCDITDVDIQKIVSKYAQTRSPKTVRNLTGFISPVLRYFDKGRVLDVATPPKEIVELYTPDDDEVERLVKRIEGTRFEIAVMLGAFAVRRSEICALTLDDFNFEENSVFVHRAKVKGKNGGWVIVERNKTSKSRRKVYLPEIVCLKIKERGCVYRGNPNDISEFMGNIEKELGINHFTLHRLRSYYASISDYLHLAEVSILDQGGWSSPHVMKQVYRKKLAQKNKESAQITVKHFETMVAG